LTQGAELPPLELRHDDTLVTNSCRIVIAPGTVVADTNGNGVLQLAADDLTIEFAPGSVLRGAPGGTPPDELIGAGIRIAGHKRIILRQARVHGFKVGLWATGADGLAVEGGDFSGQYAQRLKSTPSAEDGSDWLFPHHNDQQPWREQYGAAVCLESMRQAVVSGIRVRQAQNGILLDRVAGSKFYDNDCSFLSGWGLALWRSSSNIISRNAFDFCVRGHVEGIYNRGQDSAGILCFEQSNDNFIAQNSATHGGDGFFGFAGREAIGELWMEQERTRLRRETGREDVDEWIRVPEEVSRRLSALGCNRNILLSNDFSYAAAHGIELTFSEENLLLNNRLVENAICGIWGGYSSRTLIAGNTLESNGGMAYGLERGGINMEHAADNVILNNHFRNNKCAIHFWWDNDAALMRLPGVAGGLSQVTGNLIAGNRFEITPEHLFTNRQPETLIVLQLRDEGRGNVYSNIYCNNRLTLTASNAMEFAVDPGCEPILTGTTPRVPRIQTKPLGKTRPVGARSALHGRHRIIMHEWGPWDHEAPLVRAATPAVGDRAYDLFGFAALPAVKVIQGAVTPTLDPATADRPARLTLTAGPGVTPFRLAVGEGSELREIADTLVRTRWKMVVFPWKHDPRTNETAWRDEARSPSALTAEVDHLHFAYGWGGPRTVGMSEAITREGPGSDHFGMIATTRLNLPAGRWLVRTLSDDGVRVQIDGRKVLENWTWHGPTTDTAVHAQAEPGEVDIQVEHFEIDGYAVLRLDLEPLPPLSP
jgi:parallel beta-helix repeat protein